MFSLLFGLFPAQNRQNSRITLEQYEACTGLSNSECCEQMVTYSSFRATGRQLPKLTASTLRLSCGDKELLASPASCKSLAFSRGFSAKLVKLICESGKVKKECGGNEFCTACAAELVKLDYQDTYWVCYAATSVDRPRASKGATVVEITEAPKNAGSDGTAVIIKRRRELK